MNIWPRLHRFMWLLLGCPLLTATSIATAWAQAANTSPIVLSLPASTRALGLGNTFLPFGGDPDAVFYQPAALSGLGGASAGLQVYGSSSVLATFSAGGAIAGGQAAVGVQSLLYPSGAGGPPQLIGDLMADGVSGGGEVVGSVGWSREILGLRAGITGKLIEQRNGGARDATGAVDLGVTAEAGPFILSGSAHNLGSAPNVSTRDVSLPRMFVLGAAFETQVVGPLDVTGGAQMALRRDREVIPSGGVEIRWWPIQGRTFVGRVGARGTPEPGAQPFTFGAAFIADDLTVEYAFESMDGDGNAHRFGVRWR
jgi:hypothetical protein